MYNVIFKHSFLSDQKTVDLLTYINLFLCKYLPDVRYFELIDYH